MNRRLSRRGLLLSAGALGLATVGGLESGILPGRARVHDALGLTGEDGVVPDVPAGPVISSSFQSTARRTSVGWSVIYPHGHRPDAKLPVLLVMHGRGGDHTSAINDLGADRFLTAVVRSGTPPFALATVDGGPDTYWHQRSTGDDPQRMITAELLPLLAERGLRTTRYGVLGWSMGGYGALLSARLAAGRVVTVGAMSPALWRHADETAPGAFDGRVQAGTHTAGYWRRMLPDQLRYLGGRLAELAG